MCMTNKPTAIGLGENRERGVTRLCDVGIPISLGTRLGHGNFTQVENTGIRWKFTSNLKYLDFSDEITLISSKCNNIQDKTTAVKKWTEKAGQKVNVG